MHADAIRTATESPAAASPANADIDAATDASRAPHAWDQPVDPFLHRHVGGDADRDAMLAIIDNPDLDALIDRIVPDSIRFDRPLALRGLDPDRPLGEQGALEMLRALERRNRVERSLIGMGYADCVVPPVLQRNLLENPAWYTPYTPYQAEISQGRLEALLTFQTMISDLTGLPVTCASLLDEATAAAEAMAMCIAHHRGKRSTFAVDRSVHPQVIGVLETRAAGIGVTLAPFDDLAAAKALLDDPTRADDLAGMLLAYPTSDGRIRDLSAIAARLSAIRALSVVTTDPLALVLLRPPATFGIDIAVGSSQRFGVPLGFGGPHAGYLACREALKRQMPGRIIGVSRDVHGSVALRMALQTREQHIRREKATSNICTAQALLASLAAMYAVYHGPDGLRRIARRVHGLTVVLAEGLRRRGCALAEDPFFDTLRIVPPDGDADAACARARDQGINLRRLDDHSLGVTLDERSTFAEVEALWHLIAPDASDVETGARQLAEALDLDGEGDRLPSAHRRTDAEPLLTHPVFHQHHTEHAMLRFLHRLAGRDLSLTTSMIPLGSCTMKLNATAEMMPLSWPGFAHLHPFAPASQTAGYRALFDQLGDWLAQITGFDAVSFQPNAGAQGEYAGLLTIRAYHAARGEAHRDVCLIPVSAHGTNPASAVMTGLRVVTLKCDERGDIDREDLEAKAAAYADQLAALMITYPSTHGVFERGVGELCAIIHRHGGQVYLDGANMNAQVGLCRPGDYGADVCHLNLHKTFCIPHGGGGPGMGPIGVKAHLAPFLPGHPVVPPAAADTPADAAHGQAIGPIAAATWGSPSILTISWMYIALMGADGLTEAAKRAILHANYMAARLRPHYPILYTGPDGHVAHEFILDLRPFQKSAGIDAQDVAKRLMDFGFHAPTMAWPVAGTLMIEPTESETQAEMDRYCDALIHIRGEIAAIERDEIDRDDNPLKHAPHTAAAVGADDWPHAYSRAAAAYPLPWVQENKFWPAVGRIDNAWGDRNLICTCPPLDAYEDDVQPAAAATANSP
ncbi:MAG: aminomethyl-transferring glycine dehydrogenase [Acidobacteriota bacterium]